MHCGHISKSINLVKIEVLSNRSIINKFPSSYSGIGASPTHMLHPYIHSGPPFCTKINSTHTLFLSLPERMAFDTSKMEHSLKKRGLFFGAQPKSWGTLETYFFYMKREEHINFQWK